MTFEEARAAFPVLERVAYLNAGTFGPLARATVEAMEKRLRTELQEGRSGEHLFEGTRALREGVRSQLASLLGVAPANVALTTSTTRSCNVVLAGLGVEPGDEIVTTDSEHFGLIGPARASGARVRVARIRDRPAQEAMDAILAEVGPRTRLVAVSHVLWTTGHVLPVDELRRALDVPMLVDGAQSTGTIPVAAAAFDFYTVSGQKWLCGPDATGALYVADSERLAVSAPSYLAQESYEPDGSFTPKEGAARFDSDWLPPASLAGLATAIDTAPEWRFDGAARASRRCRELLVEAGLDVVTEPGHATLVSFAVDGDPAAAATRAYEQGVVLRKVPCTPWLRASCGYWTSEDDLERLVAAVS
jgi:L-cysteine/cystine lyase